MYSKSLFILMSLVFLFVTEVHAQYQPWIERQLKLTHALNDTNLTQEKIADIINKEKSYYDNILEDILLHKTDFLNNPKKFDRKTFSLEHMINLNKRMGNKYAVIRDEVLVKSYKLITYQNQMVRKIFQALDYYTIDELEAKMSDLFAQNQIDIRTLEDVDYKPYLAIKEKNSVLQEAQKNIKDFYALIEINTDILRYLSTSDKTMYRLNKYAKYNLLSTVLFIHKQPLVQILDPWLGYVGLNVVKVLLILFVSLIIYFIRHVLYGVIESILLKTRYMKTYTQEILDDIRTPIAYLLLVINAKIALYIYYDFSTFPLMSKLFNITYAIFFTVMMYQVLNTIARIMIEQIGNTNKSIKDEMINVTIKIINFIIIIIGLLLVLYFAGVNLTAVLSGLGIGGFAVALAARESLANFFGTISILLSDMFSQGDWIVVGDKEGTVVEIGLRVTITPPTKHINHPAAA